jgi:hypothetical protein
MPTAPLRILIAAGLALASSAARAQPQPAPVTTPATGAPEAVADPQTQQEVGAMLAKARTCYRKGTTAEQVTLRVSWPDGRESKSTVTLLIDSGVPDLGWPRRLRMELGRLTIVADDKTLTAINTQDPGTYFTAVLPEGLTLAALRTVLPPIPLPQLDWALSDSDAPIDAATAIAGAGPVAWGPETTESRTGQVTFEGTAQGGPVQIAIDGVKGALVHVSAPYGTKSASGQARLDIDVAPVPPAEQLTPDKWGVDTAGRVPVGFLAELKGRPPEIITGDRLPALSLTTADLGTASVQELLSPRDEGPLPSTRPVFGALVIYRAQPDAVPPADALAAVKSASALRSLLAARFPDASKRPRVIGLVVPCLDLQEFSRARLGEIDKQWGAVTPPAPTRAFSPTGGTILSRLAHNAGAAMVIVDADQKVLKAIPLDGRASEDAAIAQEALTAIIDWLSPLP